MVTKLALASMNGATPTGYIRTAVSPFTSLTTALTVNDGGFWAVAHGNNRYVALWNSANSNSGVWPCAAYVSTDNAVTWQEYLDPFVLKTDLTSKSYNTTGLSDIAFHQGNFFIVIRDRIDQKHVRVLWSETGSQWSELTNTTNLPWLSGPDNHMGSYPSLCSSGNTLLISTAAGGSDPAVTGNRVQPMYRSTDGGFTWTPITLPEMPSTDSVSYITSIGYGNGRFLATGMVGNGSYHGSWTSDDEGVTWVRRGNLGTPASTNRTWVDVGYVNGYWRSVNTDGGWVVVSQDGGDSWTSLGNITTAGSDYTGVIATNAVDNVMHISSMSNAWKYVNATKTTWTPSHKVTSATFGTPELPPNQPTVTAPAAAATLDPRLPHTVTWTYSDPEGRPQDQWEISYAPSGTTDWKTILGTGTQTSYAVPTDNFADETTYDLRVRTADKWGGWSTYSAVRTFTTTTWTTLAEVTSATQSANLATTGFDKLFEYETSVRTSDAEFTGPWSNPVTFDMLQTNVQVFWSGAWQSASRYIYTTGGSWVQHNPVKQ